MDVEGVQFDSLDESHRLCHLMDTRPQNDILASTLKVHDSALLHLGNGQVSITRHDEIITTLIVVLAEGIDAQ